MRSSHRVLVEGTGILRGFCLAVAPRLCCADFPRSVFLRVLLLSILGLRRTSAGSATVRLMAIHAHATTNALTLIAVLFLITA